MLSHGAPPVSDGRGTQILHPANPSLGTWANGETAVYTVLYCYMDTSYGNVIWVACHYYLGFACHCYMGTVWKCRLCKSLLLCMVWLFEHCITLLRAQYAIVIWALFVTFILLHNTGS